jgi:phosphatidylserine/phosphatidylglycerophosphate/cardiolipin synthase-like enzyme
MSRNPGQRIPLPVVGGAGERPVPGRRPRRTDCPPSAGPAAAPSGHVELVADGAHFDRIVRDGLLRARTSVDVMTADFKAMLVPDRGAGLPGRSRRRAPSIVEHLRKLAAAGVEVRLLHAGTPSGAALKELKALTDAGGLPPGLTIRRCPRLHAKAVVVDCRRMYLGSANLTGAGLGAKADGRRNFELGVWTESPDLIDAVLEQFNALWEGRRCDGCGRKDVCPVPLEEPDL